MAAGTGTCGGEVSAALVPMAVPGLAGRVTGGDGGAASKSAKVSKPLAGGWGKASRPGRGGGKGAVGAGLSWMAVAVSPFASPAEGWGDGASGVGTVCPDRGGRVVTSVPTGVIGGRGSGAGPNAANGLSGLGGGAAGVPGAGGVTSRAVGAAAPGGRAGIGTCFGNIAAGGVGMAVCPGKGCGVCGAAGNGVVGNAVGGAGAGCGGLPPPFDRPSRLASVPASRSGDGAVVLVARGGGGNTTTAGSTAPWMIRGKGACGATAGA